jgi:hypothetical protein
LLSSARSSFQAGHRGVGLEAGLLLDDREHLADRVGIGAELLLLQRGEHVDRPPFAVVHLLGDLRGDLLDRHPRPLVGDHRPGGAGGDEEREEGQPTPRESVHGR